MRSSRKLFVFIALRHSGGDLDLSDPMVKIKIKERYGNKVPLDETVISPGEMFSSALLVTVIERIGG
jgi:hypothetical protein